MKPCREIAGPHPHVLEGSFQQAELVAAITGAGDRPRFLPYWGFCLPPKNVVCPRFPFNKGI